MTYTVRADDAYVQGDDSVSVNLAATAGGTLRTWPPRGRWRRRSRMMRTSHGDVEPDLGGDGGGGLDR